MFIEVKKGDRILSIPAGALKTYAAAGWEVQGEKKSVEPEEEVKEPETQEPELSEVEEEEVPEETEEAEEEEVEYVDPEELKERPLSELDFEELQILAEYLGIAIQGIKSSKTLRAKIKEVL